MMKNMDDISIIMELEGGSLEIEDMEDWYRVKDIAENLSTSQGFYGRLLASMEEFEEYNDIEDTDLYPLYM